ncbi:MAG: extracellular solute-binding protein [Acidimicrobiia bacterium]|nr:extracellular solute-binding protein [Acidimicrobiia bacterium]
MEPPLRAALSARRDGPVLAQERAPMTVAHAPQKVHRPGAFRSRSAVQTQGRCAPMTRHRSGIHVRAALAPRGYTANLSITGIGGQGACTSRAHTSMHEGSSLMWKGHQPVSRSRLIRGTALVVGAVMFAACGGDDSDGGASASEETAPAAGASADPFENLVAAAKEEGSVVFYTGESQQVLETYAQGFKEEYGIDVVIQNLTQGPMQERLDQEFQAGRVQADVAGNTLDAAWNERAAAEGHLADLTEEELPNMAGLPDEHKGQYHVIHRLNPMGVFYNTELVEEETLPDQVVDIPQMADWKGRVAVIDPTLGGAIHEWHYQILQVVGEERYEAFVNGLVGDLDAQVSGAISALVGQVSAGELMAIVGIPSSLTVPSVNAGVPAQVYYPEPVTIYRSSLQALADGPHPNAAKLFINWLLSEEGATASCGGGICTPPHMDVEGQIEFPETATFVDGITAREVGDSYINGLVASAAN